MHLDREGNIIFADEAERQTASLAHIDYGRWPLPEKQLQVDHITGYSVLDALKLAASEERLRRVTLVPPTRREHARRMLKEMTQEI